MIDEIIVSKDVFEQYFVCNLDKCRGACCWEGDYGAPLDKDEIEIIEGILDQILPYLNEASKSKISSSGWKDVFSTKQFTGTQLLNDGSCVFLIREGGIAQCAFERAYNEGKTSFKKPISCHLYPIRVDKNEVSGFEALNYDEWEICSAACSFGDENKVKLFQFVKEALIRKYGIKFYEKLNKIAFDLFQD